MPILEKKNITVKAYMKERLQYTPWAPDVFERQCRNSLKNKENFKIIDGTTEFTISIKNLYEYFKPIESKPTEMDSVPIEAKPIAIPKPNPKPKPEIKEAEVVKK